MLNNFKITGKLTIGFGIVLALFAVAVFFSWQSISAVQSDVSYLQVVVDNTVKLAVDLTNDISWIRACVRDLKFSESDNDIERMQGFFAQLRTDLERGKRMYAQNPTLTSLSSLAEMENLLRNAESTFSKAVQLIRNKRTVSATLNKEIDKMIELLTSVVDMQYQITLDKIKTSLEGADFQTDIERIRLAEALTTAFAVTARNYAIALNNRDAKMMNDIVQQLVNGEAMYNKFYEGSRFKEVKDLMTAGRGTFTTLKNGFNDVLNAFTQTEPIFAALLADGLALVQISNKITDAGTQRITDLSQGAFDSLSSTMTLLISLAIAAIVIGVGIALYIAKSISKPLGRVVELCGNASNGDMSIIRDDFNYEGKDELGELGDALSDMFASLSTAISDIRGLAIESHDKSSAMKEDAGKNLDYANNVRSSVSNVVKLMESNSSSLQESNAGTEEMSAASMTSAQAATDCAEFISNMTTVTGNAVNTVKEAIANIVVLQRKTKESGIKLQALVENVNKISEFIGDITSIADQTNLLALNAAIEAARAGEAGRGFAVVAESVRKLAEESSRAAENVRGLIETLQEAARETKTSSDETAVLLDETTEKANGAQDSLAEAIGQIDKANDRIQNIAAVAEEQAASSREIAAGIDNVTKATTEILEHLESIKNDMDETAMIAERAAQGAVDQTGLVESITESLSQFKIEHEGTPGKKAAAARKALPAKQAKK
ncbi:MAG: methyl-accepting chemotaxis protein [Synergistaceae bacterium]|nr:methyl-accepting chemotaxis protein [Synergistaceae bacterium]MBQ6738719.1 methyl-accepting chemotaxis protein [Synergistaceae bacterium]MBR0075414.1 methyl-accepting chemotaxis protein [Synergistaceae bacterium]MBR0252467.1 methyl-accepting chemotaxis protein [Synergistaceae bacterium]